MAAKFLSSFIVLLFLVDSSVGIVPNNITSSPFGFLNQLIGSQKGNETKGIDQLKSYLQKFGYLDHTQANDNDKFDDAVELAIKTYQQNYHIPSTGVLDAETVSMMTAPRCGVPDIINGTNTMQPRKRSRARSGSIHTVSHYAFFAGYPRWPASKTTLTYSFLSNVPPAAMPPVNRAFERWADATQYFRFTSVPSGQDSDLVIGFFRGDHGDGSPFDGPNGILAHSFPPTDGRFHYDADEQWSVRPLPGYYHLESVATHEIGHLLGLAHSSVEEAIMHPGIAPGQTRINIAADDVQGIKALYGI